MRFIILLAVLSTSCASVCRTYCAVEDAKRVVAEMEARDDTRLMELLDEIEAEYEREVRELRLKRRQPQPPHKRLDEAIKKAIDEDVQETDEGARAPHEIFDPENLNCSKYHREEED